jgi:hypothetical protein
MNPVRILPATRQFGFFVIFLIIHLYNKQRLLVHSSFSAVVKGFWDKNVYKCVITVPMVWWSFAVKGFSNLWDNIMTVVNIMLLKVSL